MLLLKRAPYRQALLLNTTRWRYLSTVAPPDAIPSNLRPIVEPHAIIHSHPDHARKSAYLYFDCVFPLRIGVWDLRYLWSQAEKDSLLDNLKSLVPQDSAYDVKVEEVLERSKDGGAFVKFSFVPPTQPYSEPSSDPAQDERATQAALQTIEKEVKAAVHDRGYKPWVNFGPFSGQAHAFLVKGKPWLEDMHRFPNNVIKVDFDGAEIDQERLFGLFRPYGKISNIFPPTKDAPKTATVAFRSVRAAAAARNCLHGLTVNFPTGATTLRILYGERVRAHYIRDWATSHPRLMLPLIVALIGSISYAIFDPLRALSIRNHIEGTFSADKWRIVRWLKRETLGRLGLADSHTKALAVSDTGIEKERLEAKQQIEAWLRDTPDTFILVTGPRGSGKTGLVDEIVSKSKNVLEIDCGKIAKSARTETKLISELASSVGYWPQFVLASSVNNMIDLASVSLIGQKSGFSASVEQQVKQILEVTTTAIKTLSNRVSQDLAREAQSAQDQHDFAERRAEIAWQLAHDGVRDGRLDTVAGNGAMSELGGGLESGWKEGEEVIIGPRSASFVRSATQEPEECEQGMAGLPIIVLKGFPTKGEPGQQILWDALSDWAAVLVENQVAHVIFTSDSATLNKPLAKALPNRPFNTVALNDASLEASLQYVSSKLSTASIELPETSHPSIAKLGGRQTDLELLVSKIRAGLDPEEAVQEIISRNATELRKAFFGDDNDEAKNLKWTRNQVWSLMKGLVANHELKYADVLVNSPFSGNDAPLRELENAQLITIHHNDGRPSVVRPGKPVYRSAFKHLLSDDVFVATLAIATNASATASAQADLDSSTRSLLELSQLFGGQQGANGRWVFGGSTTIPPEIEYRIGKLLAKMGAAEKKLESLAQEKEQLLQVLRNNV